MLTSPSATSRVSLLFTSDEHGYISRQSQLQKEVDETRATNPEGTLFVSCGDVFEGSAENGVLGIDASRSMLALAGYDLMTVGNHDFDRGPEIARDWVKNSPCDVVCSNLKDAHTGELLEHSSASKVYTLNGVKVGFIGATTTESVTILPKSKLEGLSIEDPAACVQAEVEKLKAGGVEVIGLVSHLGLPTDRKLADAVPELDFILGGHTHDALEKPEQRGQTLIIHPGCFRKSLGHLDLDIDPVTGQIKSVDYKLVKADPAKEDEGAVGRLARTYQHQVEEAMGKVVATLPDELEYDPNILGEAMEGIAARAAREKSGADLVMINQKGLRAGLAKGDVKVGDIYNVFPFDNHIITVEMTAAQAVTFYNESIRRCDQTSFAETDAASIRYAVNRQTREPLLVANTPAGQIPAGETPNPVEANCRTLTNDVPADAVLKVATLDFLLEGGLGYFNPGSQKIQGDCGTVRDALTEFLGREYPKLQH